MPEDLEPKQKRLASLTIAIIAWVALILLLLFANYALSRANAGLAGDSSGTLMAPLGIVALIAAAVALIVAISSTLAAVVAHRNAQDEQSETASPPPSVDDRSS